MTRKRVTDEEYGCLVRRTGELVRRVDEGTLPFQEVMDGLQVLIEGRGEKSSLIESIHKVTVDYTKSLAEMIEAGKYDWKYSDITQEHFPVQGQGREEKDVVLFHFGRYISSGDAIAEMAKAGYCPVQIQELLAFGGANPELQKQFPIVALGSVWRDPGGRRHVPYLDWHDRGRGLSLGWFGSGWGGDYRFAAVRNSS